MTFQVSRDDDGADIVCSVNHESLKGADRSTSQRIEVLCMLWACGWSGVRYELGVGKGK